MLSAPPGLPTLPKGLAVIQGTSLDAPVTQRKAGRTHTECSMTSATVTTRLATERGAQYPHPTKHGPDHLHIALPSPHLIHNPPVIKHRIAILSQP